MESGDADVTVGATVRIRYQGACECVSVSMKNAALDPPSAQRNTFCCKFAGIARPATVLSHDPGKQVVTVDMNDPLAGRVLQIQARLNRFDMAPAVVAVHIDEPNAADVPARRFTLAELRQHTGANEQEIYVSLCGFVYDVSSSSHMYGK